MIMYLSTKGQVTIPQAVHEQAGIGPGSAVEIAFRDNEIYLRRTNDAAFLAGQSHRRYRHKGGTRDRTLPDFFIGAHAIVSGLTLVTRDPRRYRQHFPRLKLIAPDTHVGELVPVG